MVLIKLDIKSKKKKKICKYDYKIKYHIYIRIFWGNHNNTVYEIFNYSKTQIQSCFFFVVVAKISLAKKYNSSVRNSTNFLGFTFFFYLFKNTLCILHLTFHKPKDILISYDIAYAIILK